MATFLSNATNPPAIGKDAFHDNDWATIIKACQLNAVPDTWIVGEQKPMTINGTEYVVNIIGKNHDVYSDGTGVAPLTFQLFECYKTEYPMHGTSNNTGGWRDSKMRSTHLPALLALMPSEVQSAIREVNKQTSAGNKSATIVTTADKLFLLSEAETLGRVSFSHAGEGNQYEYYSMGYSPAKLIDDVKAFWWLRSPYSLSVTYYCCIGSDGGYSYLGASGENAVAFAFCF